jgi:hypothetical protein
MASWAWRRSSGLGVGGGDDVAAGLELDAAVAAGGADELRMGQLVWRSIQRERARAASTIVRWASMESRWWWPTGWA